jgi:hypothetical protein
VERALSKDEPLPTDEEGDEVSEDIAEEGEEEEQEPETRIRHVPTPRVEVLEPGQIVSAAYQSLDKQIAAIDEIPKRTKEKGDSLVKLTHTDSKLILQNNEDILEFRQAVLALNQEVGHDFHALFEMDREHRQPQQNDGGLPSLPEIPQLPIGGQQQAPQMPPMVVGQPNVTIKKGMFSSFWEHMSNRRWAAAYEKAVQSRQPEITTSKVIDVLDYGRQLESEFMRLLTFHFKGVKRVYFFNDKATIRNQMEEIQLEVTKIAGIIAAFSTAITEYRKERYGDRKVGVAAGAMYLEAAQASSLGNLRLSDLLRAAREDMGPENVEES